MNDLVEALVGSNSEESTQNMKKVILKLAQNITNKLEQINKEGVNWE